MKQIFKSYNQQQEFLLPPSLEQMIPSSHPVRVVNRIVEKINIEFIYSTYKGGGTSSFDPRMLLKVMVYAYMTNIYSSRKIEALLQENINFMWLSGFQRPDHNTINRFRLKLQTSIKPIFAEIVLMMHDLGMLNIKDIYTDGTKIESAANRYTFVWGKAIRNRKEKIRQQIDELWQYAEQITTKELLDTRPTCYEEVSSAKIESTVESINKALESEEIDKKIRQKLKRVKRVWPEQLQRYEAQEQELGSRNSYSKTDTDATFMRMKEDHMMNGQLKPGYNVQISTNNQVITNYSIHQTTADTTTLIEHIEEYKSLYKQHPDSISADAGYGSEENYQYAEDNKIDAFIKYNYFHKEQTKKWKSDIHRSENLYYNAEIDCYYCPMGQPMRKIGEYKAETKTGFVQTMSRYQALNCSGCPLRGSCHKSRGNRIIEINKKAKLLKDKAKANLTSEKGLEKRSRRPIEPEAVFGNIKKNKNFKRFMLRGLKKVEIEFGLVAISHNLKKICA